MGEVTRSLDGIKHIFMEEHGVDLNTDAAQVFLDLFTEADTLRAYLEKSDKYHDELTAEISDLRTELKGLKAENGKRADVNRMAELRAEVEKLTIDIETLKSGFESSCDTIEEMRHSAEKAEKREQIALAGWNDEKEINQTLHGEVEEEKENNKILCGCLNGSTKAIYDAKGFDLAVADLRDKLRKSEAQNKALRDDFADLAMDAKRLADSTLGLDISICNYKLRNARELVYRVIKKQALKATI